LKEGCEVGDRAGCFNLKDVDGGGNDRGKVIWLFNREPIRNSTGLLGLDFGS